jgi:RimJ/RimL family protein N-acetyltransferase
MNYILETERLQLREFTMDDTAFIIELVNSEGWLKFIGERNVKTEEQAKAYLENGPMKSYREHGFGLSMVEIKEDNRKIGMCGLLKRDTLEHPDIGFAFLPEWMGKGYAFEIACATLIYASNTLKIPTICAIVVPENNRSIKLLEKIGMTFMKRVQLPPNHEELLLYSTASK